MDNQAFESMAERTFQYQSTLPPLPVPSLEESLNKYLDAGKMRSEKLFCVTKALIFRIFFFGTFIVLLSCVY